MGQRVRATVTVQRYTIRYTLVCGVEPHCAAHAVEVQLATVCAHWLMGHKIRRKSPKPQPRKM